LERIERGNWSRGRRRFDPALRAPDCWRDWIGVGREARVRMAADDDERVGSFQCVVRSGVGKLVESAFAGAEIDETRQHYFVVLRIARPEVWQPGCEDDARGLPLCSRRDRLDAERVVAICTVPVPSR